MHEILPLTVLQITKFYIKQSLKLDVKEKVNVLGYRDMTTKITIELGQILNLSHMEEGTRDWGYIVHFDGNWKKIECKLIFEKYCGIMLDIFNVTVIL